MPRGGNRKGCILTPEQRQKCVTIKGRRWYTNGEREIELLPGQEIPEGFVLGRCYKISEYQKERMLEGYVKWLERRRAKKDVK